MAVETLPDAIRAGVLKRGTDAEDDGGQSQGHLNAVRAVGDAGGWWWAATPPRLGADAIPDSWAPHLWLAWPAGVLLAVPMIYVEIRDRPRSQYPATTPDRAARDLAVTLHQQWTVEAGLRDYAAPNPSDSGGRAPAGRSRRNCGRYSTRTRLVVRFGCAATCGK